MATMQQLMQEGVNIGLSMIHAEVRARILTHDFFYMFSDDQRVYRKGQSEYENIVRAISDPACSTGFAMVCWNTMVDRKLVDEPDAVRKDARWTYESTLERQGRGNPVTKAQTVLDHLDAATKKRMDLEQARDEVELAVFGDVLRPGT